MPTWRHGFESRHRFVSTHHPKLEGKTVDAQALADLLFEAHDHIDADILDHGLGRWFREDRTRNISYVPVQVVYDWIEHQTGTKPL